MTSLFFIYKISFPLLPERHKKLIFKFKNAYVREIAIVFCKVEAVANYKLVGNDNARIVCHHFNLTARGLIKKCAALYAMRAAVLKQRAELLQSATAIDDILNNDNVYILDVALEVETDFNKAGCHYTCAIGGYLHKLHGARTVDTTEEVGCKQNRALEHDYKNKFTILIRIISIDLCSVCSLSYWRKLCKSET